MARARRTRSRRPEPDLVATATVGIARALVHSTWAPVAAFFSHPAPVDPAPYHRVLGLRVRFGSEFTGLVFPVELDAPVTTSDFSLRPCTRQFLRMVAGAPRRPRRRSR